MSFVDDLREIKAAPEGEKVFLAHKPTWRRQIRDLHHHETAACGNCSTRIEIDTCYRCYYCGVFFCAACSPEHFGQTREQYAANTDAPEAA